MAYAVKDLIKEHSTSQHASVVNISSMASVSRITSAVAPPPLESPPSALRVKVWRKVTLKIFLPLPRILRHQHPALSSLPPSPPADIAPPLPWISLTVTLNHPPPHWDPLITTKTPLHQSACSSQPNQTSLSLVQLY